MARIALTVHRLGQGGTDRVCAHLARGFKDAGHDVDVVAVADGGAGAAALMPLFGGDMRMTFLRRGSGSRPIDLAMGIEPMTRWLRAARPDVVLSTGNNMNWMTALAAKAARVPPTRVALKTTNPIVRPKDNAVARGIRETGYARAFGAADRVLTLSDEESDLLRDRFGAARDRFVTVANPYVTDAMLAVRPKQARRGRTILAVGRLAAQKRMDLAVHAFAAHAPADARLVILGEGPDRAALEALAAGLGIADRVEMPGFVTDVASWYAEADLFVLPSRYEGLPAVALEAMAADCPVVATDCFPAARRLMAEAPGCDLAPAEIDGFGRVMAAALARPRPAGLRDVAARYSVERAVASHLDALAPLIA